MPERPPTDRHSTDAALARRWVKTWQQAAPHLEQVRRDELRRLDPQRALALLCGDVDYTVPPRTPRPTSGLVEQQRWFMKLASRFNLAHHAGSVSNATMSRDSALISTPTRWIERPGARYRSA